MLRFENLPRGAMVSMGLCRGRLTGWIMLACACSGEKVRSASLGPPARGVESSPENLLTEALDGPFESLLPELQRRVPDWTSRCPELGMESEVREDARLEAAPSPVGHPIRDVRVMRTPGEVACAPIERCVVAIQTDAGWWLDAHREDEWCEGVQGTGMQQSTLTSELTLRENGLLVVSGVRMLTRNEHVLSPDGDFREIEVVTSIPYAFGCAVGDGGVPHCQRQFAATVPY